MLGYGTSRSHEAESTSHELEVDRPGPIIVVCVSSTQGCSASQTAVLLSQATTKKEPGHAKNWLCLKNKSTPKFDGSEFHVPYPIKKKHLRVY
jgi:hypothetical protein